MKEYITKDRAKQFVCGHCNEVCSEEPCESSDCDWMAFIDKEPAADVMEVVRCRECKHWKPSGSKTVNPFSDMEYIGGCEFTKYCRRESDFCSYGELKEGADND